MSVLPIYTLTKTTWNLKDISLRQPTRKIEIQELEQEWFRNIVFDMFETLYSTQSGVGLAAPQVGIQLKLIVLDIKRNGKKPIVLINPEYEPLSKDMCESNESCISVPKSSGKVNRYNIIKVKYYDLYGNLIEKECSGFESRVIQHEIDHINGILYVDKLIAGEKVNEYLGQANKTANLALSNIRE